MRDASTDAPLVSVSKRTIRRWVEVVREAMAEQTGDEYWHNLDCHDLCRTWATSLRSADVDAMVVCDWDGWQDLGTFRDHYRGTNSPEAQARQRGKVDWL